MELLGGFFQGVGPHEVHDVPDRPVLWLDNHTLDTNVALSGRQSTGVAQWKTKGGLTKPTVRMLVDKCREKADLFLLDKT